MGTPISITCKRLEIETTEFVMEAKRQGDVVLESYELMIDYSSGQVPQVINYGNGNSKTSTKLTCR